MTNRDDEKRNQDVNEKAGGAGPSSIGAALREGARRSRRVRHFIRWMGVLGFLVIAGIGVYFAGRVRGADEGRSAALSAAASEATKSPTASTIPGAGPQAAAAAEGIIPASELADRDGAPNPATPAAVAAWALELCHATGTDDHPLSLPELVEMASSQIAAFDAVAKHGGKLTAEGKRCYREAQATLEDDRKNQAEAEQP